MRLGKMVIANRFGYPCLRGETTVPLSFLSPKGESVVKQRPDFLTSLLLDKHEYCSYSFQL